MKNLMLCAAAAGILAAAAPAIAARAEYSAVRTLPAFDLPAAPGTLQTPLPSFGRRAQAQEQRSAPAADEKAQTGPKNGAIAEVKVYKDIAVSLDYASIVDENQLLLEFSIINRGTAPVLTIVASFLDSSVGLRGEAKPRVFHVRGLANCPTYQTNVTGNCQKLTEDEQWTLLEPQVPYQFQIVTDAVPDKINADSAFARIRFLFREGKKTVFRDAAFAHISLTN